MKTLFSQICEWLDEFRPVYDPKQPSARAKLDPKRVSDFVNAKFVIDPAPAELLSQRSAEMSVELGRYAVAAWLDELANPAFGVGEEHQWFDGGNEHPSATSVRAESSNSSPAVASRVGRRIKALYEAYEHLRNWTDTLIAPAETGSQSVVDYLFSSQNAGVSFYKICDAIISGIAKNGNFGDSSLGLEGLNQAAEIYFEVLRLGFEGKHAGAAGKPSRDYYMDGLGGKLRTGVDLKPYDGKPFPLPPKARSLETIARSDTDGKIIRVPINGGVLFVDENGIILGPLNAGSSAYVVFGQTSDIKPTVGSLIGAARAIRIPQLTEGDLNLNYQVAENFYRESRQSQSLSGIMGLANTSWDQNFLPVAQSRRFGLPDGNVFIGFYMSGLGDLRVAALGETAAWPPDFASRLGDKINETYMKLKSLSERPLDDGALRPMFYIANKISNVVSERFLTGMVVDRIGIDKAYRERDSGGWWFFPPVATSPWLSADLQRMLTHMVADPSSRLIASPDFDLRKVGLAEWFRICEHLCEGVELMHMKGAIHGDVRPANIMKRIGSGPGSFEWIDLGLGIQKESIGGDRLDNDFHPPERKAESQFEDVDTARITMHEKDASASLTLQYKPLTSAEPVPLTFRVEVDSSNELNTATDASLFLADIRPGDRVGIRNLLFEVVKVETRKIIVGRVSEIFLRKFVHEASLTEVVRVHEELPVPMVKLHFRWGQATDIYGFGALTLYLFFMRGLWAARRFAEKTDLTDVNVVNGQPQENASQRSSAPPTEKTGTSEFRELIRQLRNRTFLDSFLSFVHNSTTELVQGSSGSTRSEGRPFAHANEVFGLSSTIVGLTKDSDLVNSSDLSGNVSIEQGSQFERLSKVANRSINAEGLLVYVYYGVNCSPALFTQLIYFVLRCLWRKEELASIRHRRLDAGSMDEIGFIPFSKSREFISPVSDKNSQAGATTSLKASEEMSEAARLARLCLKGIAANFPAPPHPVAGYEPIDVPAGYDGQPAFVRLERAQAAAEAEKARADGEKKRADAAVKVIAEAGVELKRAIGEQNSTLGRVAGRVSVDKVLPVVANLERKHTELNRET